MTCSKGLLGIECEGRCLVAKITVSGQLRSLPQVQRVAVRPSLVQANALGSKLRQPLSGATVRVKRLCRPPRLTYYYPEAPVNHLRGMRVSTTCWTGIALAVTLGGAACGSTGTARRSSAPRPASDSTAELEAA